LADEIRRHERQTLSQRGADPHATLYESIHVRDGFLCGRRFELYGLSAVWFVEERQLKFFDRTGTIFDICHASYATPVRRAA
jgi:hypothetical protein